MPVHAVLNPLDDVSTLHTTLLHTLPPLHADASEAQAQVLVRFDLSHTNISTGASSLATTTTTSPLVALAEVGLHFLIIRGYA